MSGTPEKILELLLEAMRPDSSAHDPTGRGRRHPACFLTQRVVSTAWKRARHPASDLIGCSIGLFGQLARSFRFCVLGLCRKCCDRDRVSLLPGLWRGW